MRVLVTRPETEGERTAALLRSCGHEVVLEPLLRIEAIADAELRAGPWQAALMTSANAARAIAAHRRAHTFVGLPAYVVGARTKAAAATAGFDPVYSADGDVGDLIALVSAKLAPAGDPLVYFAGQERAGNLAGALRGHGFRVETVVVYRAVIAATLSRQTRDLLASGRIDAVLHYSARSAGAFVAAVTAAGIAESAINIKHLCLSSEIAAPLVAAGAKAVAVAAEPNEVALIERLGN